MNLSAFVGLFLLLLQRSTCFDHTVVVPKAFRIDAPEKVILNLHGYQQATITAYLQDLPFRQETFNLIDLVLNDDSAKNPIELEMMVRTTDIHTFRQRQVIDVVIEVSNSKGKDFISHTEVLLSKQSGYIYVITDRPAYKPQEEVNIQAFPLRQTMEPDFSTLVLLSVKTPDGISVQKRSYPLPTGDNFVDDIFEISQNPVLGKWSVEAKYAANGYETTVETHFIIQRYVLPAFQVSIHPTKNFILATDKFITGTIKATYSYGKPVSGNYFLTMKLKMSPDSDDDIPFFKKPKNFRIAVFRSGEQTFKVDTSHIADVLTADEKLHTLVENQASIYIEATVNARDSGVMESAISPSIPFVASPYIIDTTRTSLYFTPTLTYQLKVDVHFAIGGKIAPFVNVEIRVQGINEVHTTESNAQGQVDFHLDFGREAQVRVVVIRTADYALPPPNDEAQAEKILNIQPYKSPSESYLHILSKNNEVNKVGTNTQFKFSFNAPNPNQFRYYVLARGSIVHTGLRNTPQGRATEFAVSITITQQMVPSARIVAYYIRGREIVSDSLWIDVEDKCKTDLSLQVPPDDVFPGADLEITITGPGGALVSVTGVDKAAYFLYNGSRLTRDRMFHDMKNYDQGCTRNGADTKSVFMNTGLYISSRELKQLPVRSLVCDTSQRRRKKRNVISEERANQIKLDSKLYKCELDGSRSRIMENDTCIMRRQRCEDDKEDHVSGCCDKFLSACKEAEKERRRAEKRQNSGRSNSRGAGNAEASIRRLRENFQESLFFTTIRLEQNGKSTYRTEANDQITTFEIDAVSMHDSNDGFCVAKTAEVRVFKDVFLKLTTPYSLRKLEQTNLKISVFNYNKSISYLLNLEVMVEDTKSICTTFPAGNWKVLQRIQAKNESSSPAYLTIIPLKTGTFPIFLRLRSVENGDIFDDVRKEILIEESGEIKDSSESFAIDLAPTGKQVFDIHLAFPENIVANTRQCWIYAYSDFLGPSIEVDPITEKPKSLDKIFRKPHGCGEQNMLFSGPNVYTHEYLVSSGAMQTGSRKFNQSVERIRQGYAQELLYRSSKVQGRAFAVFPKSQPSTWLNAFVDKVFIKASEHIDDLMPICLSLEWLLSQQAPDFHFKELRKPIHREMHGAVGGKFTLTAYVAISLLETQSRCGSDLNQKVHAAVENAVTFLKNNMNHQTFTRPYALALLSYTLALHEPNTDTARRIFNRLLHLSVVENGHLHWNGRLSGQKVSGTDIHAYWYNRKRPQAVDVETTAYALLAQIAMAKAQNPVSQSSLDTTRKTVLWLVSQRNSGGAFFSTQDTVIGLQALATYETWIKDLDIPVEQSRFTIQLSVSPQWNSPPPILRIDDDNLGERQEIEVPKNVINSGQDIKAVATGQGEGLLSYRCTYRTVVNEIPCHFTIAHRITLLNADAIKANREDHVSMKIKLELTISKEKGDPAEMTMVEVGFLSGFVPIISSLDRLPKSNAVDGIIDIYEVTKFKVVFYLPRVTNTSLTLAFDMEQNVEVNSPEPAKIDVYDYYEPEIQCGMFYSLPGNVPDLRTENCDNPEGNEVGEICKCAEGGCPVCRSHEDQIKSTECLHGCDLCDNEKECTNMFSSICDRNYAYVIKVGSVKIPKEGGVFYTFTGKVKEILKPGSDEDVQEGSEVTFEIRHDCYSRCWDKSLIKNTTHPDWKLARFITIGRLLTIVGTQPEEVVDRNGKHQHKYLLDENAIVERKITNKKCKKLTKRWEKNCKTKTHKKCQIWRKFMYACDNFITLIQRLEEGCD